MYILISDSMSVMYRFGLNPTRVYTWFAEISDALACLLQLKITTCTESLCT